MAKASGIIDFLEAGLRAENLRQKVIASNIANIQTPGYRSLDVKFKELLAKAMDSSGEIDLTEVEPQLYRPGTTTLKSNGNDVSLEAEIGKMFENSLRHDAYVKLLHKKYKQLELAIEVR